MSLFVVSAKLGYVSGVDMTRTVRLETERLVLRELDEADAPLLVALNEHPAVQRFTSDGPLRDRAAAVDVLRTHVFPQYRSHGIGRWAVERKADGLALGWCGLKWLSERGEYDIGYRLLPSHWNQGYATEAARACLEFARMRLGEARVVALIHVENAASVRVAHKLGLRFSHTEQEQEGDIAVYVMPAS
jgi:RimJ/RimL family protein N-acetyltransferase